MVTMDRLVREIDELNQSQREEILLRLMNLGKSPKHESGLVDEQEYPIIRTPGVCGGSPRVVRTRIPVWSLERLRQLGASDDVLLKNYPSLEQSDLNAVWQFVASHRDEIERDIQENEGD